MFASRLTVKSKIVEDVLSSKPQKIEPALTGGFFFAFICLDEAGTNQIGYFNHAGGIVSPRF